MDFEITDVWHSGNKTIVKVRTPSVEATFVLLGRLTKEQARKIVEDMLTEKEKQKSITSYLGGEYDRPS